LRCLLPARRPLAPFSCIVLTENFAASRPDGLVPHPGGLVCVGGAVLWTGDAALMVWCGVRGLPPASANTTSGHQEQDEGT
jgi:hypothetical protein